MKFFTKEKKKKRKRKRRGQILSFCLKKKAIDSTNEPTIIFTDVQSKNKNKNKKSYLPIGFQSIFWKIFLHLSVN